MRLVARLYPSGWRRRYGDEFDALLEDVRPGWRELLNVLRGAFAMQLTTWTFWKTVATVGLAGSIAAGALSLLMPGQYVSSGVLKIPARVNAADMGALLADAFNRSYLVSVIRQQNLYKGERAREPLEDVVLKMRQDITLSSLGIGQAETSVAVRFSYPDAALAQSTNREIMSRLQKMQAKIYGGAEVVNPADLPDRASHSNRSFIILCGLAAGLMIGAVGMTVRRRPRWTLRVAAIALPITLAGTAASFLIPDQYISDAVIRVPAMDPPFSSQARGRELLAKVIAVDQLYGNARSMDAAVDRMSRDLRVSRIGAASKHEVYRMTFCYTDRHKTQKAIRDVMANVVIAYAEREGGVKLPTPDSPHYNREFLAWRASSPEVFEIYDAPSLPEAPVGPNRLTIALFALAGGLIVGALLWRRPPLPPPAAVAQPVA
jgi:hypothetical protein